MKDAADLAAKAEAGLVAAYGINEKQQRYSRIGEIKANTIAALTAAEGGLSFTGHSRIDDAVAAALGGRGAGAGRSRGRTRGCRASR